MRNRAKCKLCSEIIESIHNYQCCKCGEIAVSGGEEMKCHANDFANFIRIDDNDNEVLVTVKEKDADVKPLYNEKLSRLDLINMLDEMRMSYENLPQHAMISPITHYDFSSLLMLLSEILKRENS